MALSAERAQGAAEEQLKMRDKEGATEVARGEDLMDENGDLIARESLPVGS